MRPYCADVTFPSHMSDAEHIFIIIQAQVKCSLSLRLSFCMSHSLYGAEKKIINMRKTGWHSRARAYYNITVVRVEPCNVITAGFFVREAFALLVARLWCSVAPMHSTVMLFFIWPRKYFHYSCEWFLHLLTRTKEYAATHHTHTARHIHLSSKCSSHSSVCEWWVWVLHAYGGYDEIIYILFQKGTHILLRSRATASLSSCLPNNEIKN